jgi:hypothetical protein
MEARMSEFCHLCGKKIDTRPFLYHHVQWQPGQVLRVCRDCVSHKPRCQICGIPMMEGIQPVCSTCQQHLLYCLGCGKPILTPRYYSVNGQVPYCQACSLELPTCDICGQPFSEKRWQLSDGRQYCERCYATTVNLPEEAQAIYADVTRWMEQLFSIVLNVPTSLSLVDRNQLAQVMEAQNTALLEPPERTLGIYARRGIKRGIYIQTGLPRLLFIQVCSHELTHAWQGENCPLLHNTLVREGTAEWAAWKVLEALGERLQSSAMASRTDIYGQGLRWALDLERRAGGSAVLKACRQSE